MLSGCGPRRLLVCCGGSLPREPNPKAQNLHLPLGYGQSLATEDVARPIEVTVSGKTTPLTLVFKPYQSILLTLDGNGTYRFEDITFQPKTPVVKMR
jgi:hypothetical protein